jgi:hypothetical protein
MTAKKIILSLTACILCLAGYAQHYWQQEVDYTIDVTLNAKDRSLDGFIKMQYSNHSPDTLYYIWMHLWPNAYKNDQTAFSNQLLVNGNTDFYFSDKEQRGYINRLDFRVDGLTAELEDHPRYIDIIKVILPRPLPPEGVTTITSPFHVKLPYNFSRGGYAGRAFQITQWYPKPAVYNAKGWHPIPYLDQGEFYSEFGSFDVHITVPDSFVVASTGNLQDSIRNNLTTKTLHYTQTRIHDFAWFADPHFHIDQDTLALPSGRVIKVRSYYTPAADPAWRNSLAYIKDAIRFRSALIGEYPFDIVTAVQTKMGTTGGMEYPTITSINQEGSAKDLDLTIEHEVGHNWFYGILGTDERHYPWMDEGINTYYDFRYEALKYPETGPGKGWFQDKLPAGQNDAELLDLNTLAAKKMDQPISTSSEDFSEDNYAAVAYTKTGEWLKMLEDTLGASLFDRCMQEYYRRWQYKHPYPDDFKAVITETSHRNLDSFFSLLDKKGPLPPMPEHRRLKPTFLFNFRNTDSIRYIGLSPIGAYNEYDGGMIGLLIHNYSLPPEHFQFALAPLYARESHQLNGAGFLSWSSYPDHAIQKWRFSIGEQRFSTISGTDSNGNRITGGFYKITPAIRVTFPNADPLSTRQLTLEWKTYLIWEKLLDNYVLKTADSLYYPTPGIYSFRYLNQLTLALGDDRILYPYRLSFQVQQAASWYRINATATMFFNYPSGGGLDLRLFGAKFGYLGSTSSSADLSEFEPKLTAVRGNEDYTYDNYWIGQNEFSGAASQQVMMRDGDLKLRTDLFQGLQGRSDNWVASINLSTTLPRLVVPKWLPLKVFFDAGTYAEAWSAVPPTSHFLYVAGLELTLFHDVIRLYAPFVYSSDFSSQLKTVPDQNTFLKKLSFSIDLENIHLHQLLGSPF